jgi:hypothetical protein
MGKVEKAALRETRQRLYGGRGRGPSFCTLFQASSKLFQGKSKLFQAFSKEFQTFSLAVFNEIKGLAPPPPISPFSRPPRPNRPRVAAAPGDRRRRRPSPKFHSYHDFRFSGRKCRGDPAGARPEGRPAQALDPCKGVASRDSPQRPPQFAVDLLDAKIPIETGCQGRAQGAHRCGGRSPLTAQFQSEKGLVKRSTANCGGWRGRRAARGGLSCLCSTTATENS